MIIRRRLTITGRVQGVFFRDSCRKEAQRLQVFGWVTNLADGRVEAVFEGDQTAVESMVSWAQHGPRSAHVQRVDILEEEPTGEAAFRVR